jgi:putative transposase
MSRMAAFRFTVIENQALSAVISRHLGARRYAYNRCLQAVHDTLDERKFNPETEVPWTGFSLINWWNAWKRSEDAGRVFAVDAYGETELVANGLAWRHEVCAQVFEEAAVDLGRALAAFSASRRGERSGKRVGFPHYAKKGRGTESFRLRNKLSGGGRASIRLGEDEARSVTLPVVGTLRVREDTRRLRRLLRPGADGTPRGRICYATVSRRRGRLVCTLTCELADFHPARRHPESGPRHFAGVDRGLLDLVVVADGERHDLARVGAPKHLARAVPTLKKASRSLSRKVPGSGHHARARRRLARVHARVANRRQDFTHRLSSSLVKTHDALCLEDLAITNMVQNRHLSRSIADAAWGELSRQLTYKAAWYGAVLVRAPRFFASTKTCSACGWCAEALALSERTFSCPGCGLVADRDTNAAANLAAWGEAEYHSASPAPDPEALGRVTNARGERSAGRPLFDGGTALATPPGGKKREPTIGTTAP